MRPIAALLLILAGCSSSSAFSSDWWGQLTLGPTDCAACTIVVSLLEQLSVIHDKPIEMVLDEVCGYFPKEFQTICVYMVNTYGDVIIERVTKGEGPDAVCHQTGFCPNQCRLYTKTTPVTVSQAPSYHLWASKPVPKIQSAEKAAAAKQLLSRLGETPWAWIISLFERLGNNHFPVEDLDFDLFSDYAELRGWHWRGRDCNDFDAHTHPGRALAGTNPYLDYDCNGIYGADSNGQAFEDEYCGKSGALGTIVVGDSGGAHFEIPPSYMNASEINKTTYSGLLTRVEDEFDLPFLSGYTGFANGTYSSSMYKYMRQRNLCNHRDYQNCGVNGMRSSGMSQDGIRCIQRNQTIDKPVLLFFELIGNDICTPHPTLDRMTTVPEFTANVLKSLSYLDGQLPSGSHVVFVGLAPGNLLWDLLNNRTHPIGATYPEVYDFLNCLEISPCWAWMNSNATVRTLATQRAQQLSAVYPQIIANYTFKNFDMAYYDFPLEQVMSIWEAQGGQAWQLIEPVDGFHPNQIAHSLMADVFYQSLLKDHPSFLGPINPNNAAILSRFGNQGGY